MKKLLPILFFASLALSCSNDDKNDNDPQLSQTPDAIAAFDNDSNGIYKGVFVGSTGVIEININNDNTVNAELQIDGSSKLYSAGQTIVAGQTISNLTFSNGSDSFDFSVNSDGSSPSVTNVDIDGHIGATIEVVKEHSDALVECFEGGYSDEEDYGIFNIIISNGVIKGLAKSEVEDATFLVNGSMNGSQMQGAYSAGSFSGTREGNSISGGYVSIWDISGSWSGNRSL